MGKAKAKSIPAKTQPIRRYWEIGFYLVVAGMAGIVVWGLLQKTPPAAPSAQEIEQEFMQSSPYAGISEHIYKHQDAKRSVMVEYPETKYTKINSFLKKVIDKERDDFDTTIKSLPVAKENYTQNISFQVPYAEGDVLSIVVAVNSDTHGAHPYDAVYAYTFDTKKQQALTLGDIMSGDKAMASVKKLVAKDIEVQTKKQGAAIGVDFLNDSLTDQALQYFVVLSRQELAFMFGRGVVTPQSSGDITVKLEVNSLADFMQNNTARAIFNVPKPPVKADPPPPPIVWGTGDCSHCVAITYDDGPGPYTAKLLDILNKHDAPASFMLIGSQVQQYPDLAKREYQAGYTVGNHTWSHPDLTTLKVADVKAQIASTNSAIEKATGAKPVFLRTPYGSYDATVLSVAKQNGLAVALWNVDTRDWADHDSALVCHRAVTNAQPGSIILMHDIQATTVDAAPCVIEGLQQRGFKLVTLERLLKGHSPGKVYFSGQ